ncbi:hypothetical protein ACOHYD_12900 [Desulfobacterota bacterium M19]
MKTDMTLFEEYQIRRIYDEDAEIWWFSVIDIVQSIPAPKTEPIKLWLARVGDERMQGMADPAPKR